MARLTHGSRIIAAVSLAATVAALAIETNAIGPIGVALAQTPGTAGPMTFDLFDEDSADPKPDVAQRLADAARRAQAPGECPLGRITINMLKGDPMMQEALGGAQRQAVLAFLDRQGIKAGRFFVDVAHERPQRNVRLDLNVSQDDIPPTIEVEWKPEKGSKVKSGDRITAKAIARDDANRWQSGIRTMDFTDWAGMPFGFHDYPRPPQNCENPPPPRTLDGVYTVPTDAPALVRLRAVAKDYAGNQTEVWADFPTGDWHGRFVWRHLCEGAGSQDDTRGIADFTLDHDGRGNLTGRLAGSIPERTQTVPPCTFKYVAPARFSARLVGSYTPGPETFSAQAIEAQTTFGRASWTCPAGTNVTEQRFFEVHETPMFRNAFRDLRRQPDGSWKLTPEGTSTTSVSGGTCTTTYSLTLHRARN